MDSSQMYQKAPLDDYQRWQPAPSAYHHANPQQIGRPIQYLEPPPPYPLENNPFYNPSRNYEYDDHQVTTTNSFQGYMQQTSVPYRGSETMLQPPNHLAETSSRPLSSSSQSTSTLSPTDETLLSEALTFTQHTSQIPSQMTRLRNPIAIPQTTPGMGQSFLRAWAPALQNQGITMQDFVAFIDNLNVLSTASPPLQVLDLAGGLVGMVPHHWAMIAGTAIQATAKLGTFAVSKGRTEMYMREVNEKMFKPRGLKVSISSTDAMRAVLRVPISQPTMVPLTAQTMNMSTAERVLTELRPYNEVLDLNVPPPTEQATTLAKLSAKQVAKQSKKNHEKIVKGRVKGLEKEEKKQSKDERKRDKRRRKEEKKAKKKARKHGKGRDSSDSGSDSSSEEDEGHTSEQKMHRRKGDKKNKEEKNAEKLLWILIESL